MKQNKLKTTFKYLSGFVLISSFMFTSRVLFVYSDQPSYDYNTLPKDLLFALSTGLVITFSHPILKKFFPTLYNGKE